MERGRMANILIVGAGPTGLTMAAALARHGLRPRIIDKAVTPPADRSRAIVIQARTLELFEDLGVVKEVLDAALVVDAINFFGPSGRHGTLRIDPAWIDSRYGRIVSLPQEETERILGEFIARSGVVVEHGVELTGLSDGAGAAEAILRHADGREERVAPDWILGCDGAHSAVRDRSGIPFVGSTYPDEGLIGDVDMHWGLPDGQLAVCPGETGVLLAFPLPGAHRFRVIMIAPATAAEQDRALGADEFLGEVRRMMPRIAGAPEPTVIRSRWLTRYRLHRKGVPVYRRGRCFVAGDAAHIHSPVGAQGMNTGIQDAYNLGWKVALVARGESPAALLDSYDLERRPVGETLLRFTDRFFAVAVGGGKAGRFVRRLLPTLAVRLLGWPFLRTHIARFVSETGIHYRHSPLSVEGHGATRLGRHAPHAGDRAPDVVLRPGRRLAELLHGPQHTLLLFAGASTALIDHFSTLAEEVGARHGALVKPVLLRRDPAYPPVGEVDLSGAVHERYGADPGAIFLVRPDGHIAFRGAATDTEALKATLRARFIVGDVARR
jgi:2-polyprenyl-6-methoxyphenol hydroxylase-like FAD-dependent oxidoreductase